MKKRILASVLALVMCFCSVAALSSCQNSNAPELDDVKERLVYLIEESKELNVIFFGVGLPVFRRESALSDRKMIYVSDNLSGYDRLSENSQHVTIDSIKYAAEQVYSEEYLAAVYESAFDGILTNNDGAYLRLYDDGNYLYQNTDLYGFTVNERIYDYSTMEIIAPSSADYINVTVESYSVGNSERITITLSFTFERGNWYLDCPTY